MNTTEILLTIALGVSLGVNVALIEHYRKARRRGSEAFDEVSASITRMRKRLDAVREKRECEEAEMRTFIPYGRWIHCGSMNIWRPNSQLRMSGVEQLQHNITAGGIHPYANISFSQDGDVIKAVWRDSENKVEAK